MFIMDVFHGYKPSFLVAVLEKNRANCKQHFATFFRFKYFKLLLLTVYTHSNKLCN